MELETLIPACVSKFYITMAIKVKAVERDVSFDKNSQKWAYVLQPELYNKLSQSKVIQEASLRSGISKGAINAAWDAIGEVIKAWATEGHSVAIPGLGSMRFGLRSKSIADVNKVGSDLITTRRVIFTPNVDIKEELKKTSINITCYDRNGELVKRVTSSDDAEIEDNDGGDDTPGGGGSNGSSGSGSGSGSGQQSGGGTTNTVNAPTISGTSPFEETTQVTMSGPAGATIYYTTDGSVPTSASTQYTEAITLSDTATVKAIAVKDGTSSSVASRTFTKGDGEDVS